MGQNWDFKKTLCVRSAEIHTVLKIHSISVALKLYVAGQLGENWLKRLLGKEAVMKKRLRNISLSFRERLLSAQELALIWVSPCADVLPFLGPMLSCSRSLCYFSSTSICRNVLLFYLVSSVLFFFFFFFFLNLSPTCLYSTPSRGQQYQEHLALFEDQILPIYMSPLESQNHTLESLYSSISLLPCR